MSDMSLQEHEIAEEELQEMPSDEATDTDDIPDQTPEPDIW